MGETIPLSICITSKIQGLTLKITLHNYNMNFILQKKNPDLFVV